MELVELPQPTTNMNPTKRDAGSRTGSCASAFHVPGRVRSDPTKLAQIPGLEGRRALVR